MKAGTEYSRCNRAFTLDGNSLCHLEDTAVVNVSISCSSLQEVLFLLNSTKEVRNNETGCTEIEIGEMDQVIQGSFSFNENLYLNGGMDRVTVRLITGSLSFAGANFVAIEGIEFISSNSSAISFDNTTYVNIFNSSFR